MPSEQFYRLSAATRGTITNACLSEFAYYGYDLASTNRMVKAAGISKGALFKYFTDKEGLFRYIYQQVASDMQAALAIKPELNEDIFGFLSRLTLEKIKYYKGHPEVYRFVTHMSKQQTHPVYATVYRSALASAQQMLEEILAHISADRLRAGVTIEQVVSTLIWVSDGLLQKYLNSIPETADSKEFDRFFDTLLLEMESYFAILRHGVYKESEMKS
ncbi:TetR/AcrR family transcriptional regulator [Alicyclobacillus sp. SO9]|uniref:TetR/AcrR family transcriptional regulator n=1 Tax=Alicyclobacillus sp. SO9 TaxID=2665646 RepID=UPI0018E7864B|nr:TetR/AcrR family transcriptional regulator [Alicyclobacillus sp. SO9]QQE79848.1 TetR/AcrR family transcriptional regulator [Alicyclobacillus sp. SO9]